MAEGISIHEAVLNVLQNLLSTATSYAPRVITALVVFLIGLLLAKIVEKVFHVLLSRLRFDTLMDKAGLSESLEKLGIRQSPSRFLPRILFWLAVLVFLQSATREAGLTSVADGIAAFFGFLPNLISAALILILGTALGQFLSGMVTNSARDSGIGFARALGGAVSGIVLIVTVVIALAQLQVDTRILNILTIVIFSGFSLAFGLTFGLGSRDTTRNIVAGFYARRLFRAGQEVEMAGEKGTLRSITTTQTLIESDGRTIAIPNTVFLDEVVRRAGTPGDTPSH